MTGGLCPNCGERMRSMLKSKTLLPSIIRKFPRVLLRTTLHCVLRRSVLNWGLELPSKHLSFNMLMRSHDCKAWMVEVQSHIRRNTHFDLTLCALWFFEIQDDGSRCVNSFFFFSSYCVHLISALLFKHFLQPVTIGAKCACVIYAKLIYFVGLHNFFEMKMTFSCYPDISWFYFAIW